ncbi:hypothetical protein [Hahella sp. HN01]|uniref:hypothetical protein n=1 Tax=unclassified Hahella TaxID=2624107 RepID=UPI001C1F08C0|nr:hypothetical protein [Hahella sp. HN01]MBU6950608.1 hypothetical protein [Hahella sp. HN01]
MKLKSMQKIPGFTAGLVLSCSMLTTSALAETAEYVYKENFAGTSLSYDEFAASSVPIFKWWGLGGTVSGEQYKAVDINGEVNTGQKKSLKFLFKGVADGKDSSVEQRFRILKPQVSVLSITFDLFIPTNFTHRTQSSTANNKFLVLWSGDYGTRASLNSVAFEYWPATVKGGAEGDSVLSYHLGPGDSDWGHKIPSATPVFAAADRGKWINYRIDIKLASAPGATDGFITVKKGGDTLFNVTGLANYSSATDINGDNGNYLDQGYFLGWANSGYSADTAFYMDNLMITLDKIPGVNPPSAPSAELQ